MNRLKFISFLASLVGFPLAAQEPEKPKAWEPECDRCGRREMDGEVEVFAQEDGMVMYICDAGHFFGEPKEFRVKSTEPEQ